MELLGIGSLKSKMGRRRFIAKWYVQRGFTGWQGVGEPPTFHLLVGFRLPMSYSSSYSSWSSAKALRINCSRLGASWLHSLVSWSGSHTPLS